MAADKTILIKLDVQEANANNRIKTLRASLKDLTEGSDDYVLVLKRIAIEEDKLSKIQSKRVKSQSTVTKAMVQQKDATGSATAATMELSRVISDAPYGIRGMANNITQLVSQLGTASKSAGGLVAALKLMGSQLMGPLGVVFLITAAVSALDFLYGANKKSTDGTKEAEKATKDYNQSLKSLEKTLTDSGVSQEKYNEKIRDYILLKKQEAKLDEIIKKNSDAIAEKDKEISDSLKEDENIRKRILSIKEKDAKQQEKIANNEYSGKELATLIDYSVALKQQQDRLIFNAETRKGKEQDIVDIIKNNLEEVRKIEELKDKISEAEEGTLQYYKDLKASEEKRRETSSKTSKEYKKQTLIIEEIQKKIEAIEGLTTKPKKKLSFFKTPKELDIAIKDSESAILRYENLIKQSELKTEMNNSLSAAKTEEERLRIKKLYDIKALTAKIEYEKSVLELSKKTEEEVAKAKAASHSADLRRAFELYKLKIDLDKDLSDEQKEQLKADAGGKLFDALKQANAEEVKSLKEIKSKYEGIFKVFKELKSARFQALFSKPDKDKENEETDLERWTRYAEAAKAIIGTITDFVDGEFNRQLAIEQNKTNVLNNELNKRLLDENLSKDEREKIQNEIAQNDEKLRLKQEKIERKRFKIQKAANIATTLMNTAVAAAGVMKDADGGFLARLSQAIPTIAFGLAQVATIARQKFQSSAGSSPTLAGGGSSGSSVRAEPSFNIVGRSNENLIANAIQSQFNQPLRAYVVARDVTNQQQLDGVISSSAST